MKTRMTVAGPVALAMAAALAFASAGCKKESPSEAGNPQAPPRSGPTPAKPGLQAEIDALRQIPVVRSPADRPLTVSERTATERDWAFHALRTGYFQTGCTNSRWDAQAIAAFEAYADYVRNGQPERFGPMTNAVLQAKAAGCADPMLEYMQARYSLGRRGSTGEQFAIDLVKACRSMVTSKHHPRFKYLAAYRAIVAAREADGEGDRAPLQLLVNTALQDLARDSNAPPAEVFQAVFDWQAYTRHKGWIDFVMQDLDGILGANWGNDSRLFCLRGSAELQRAWDARGNSWANTVTDEGWEGFRECLEKAEGLLVKSWEMNPSNAFTAYQMMQVELGQGRGRPKMEQWFQRAMTLSTNYSDAVKLMSFYLEPRWYGSEEESLKFARSCVRNKSWGGQVPLILPNVHHSLARFYKKDESPEYWQRPGVWADVRSGYERFFELNPSDVGWRHDYARDAYLCGQYEVFLAQTKLFGTGTNYTFFGGKAKFETMLRKAAAGS
ncbi:MAG TPA: hypothetical protein VJA21_03400 [Verrucomicrobiae bacterium]